MLLEDELKWIAGAGIALCLIFGGYKLYNMGWDAREAKYTTDNQIAINAAVEAAKKEWQSSQTITATGMGNVNDTKQKIQIIYQKAATVKTPLCTDLGSDYVSVYNDTIRTIQAGSDTSRNVSAAKVPATVPNGATGGNGGASSHPASN